MSAGTYLTINCDGGGCSAETHWPLPVASHAELRRLRRADGWRTRRAPAGGNLQDLCPDCAAAAYPKPGPLQRAPLTPRQTEALTHAAAGHTVARIGELMGITREQVAARLSEAYRRLDVTYLPRGERRAEAVRVARYRGLIPGGGSAQPALPVLPSAAAADTGEGRGDASDPRAPSGGPEANLPPSQNAQTPQGSPETALSRPNAPRTSPRSYGAPSASETHSPADPTEPEENTRP